MRGEEREEGEGNCEGRKDTPRFAVKLHRRAFHSHCELREQWRRQEMGRKGDLSRRYYGDQGVHLGIETLLRNNGRSTIRL